MGICTMKITIEGSVKEIRDLDLLLKNNDKLTLADKIRQNLKDTKLTVKEVSPAFEKDPKEENSLRTGPQLQIFLEAIKKSAVFKDHRIIKKSRRRALEGCDRVEIAPILSGVHTGRYGIFIMGSRWSPGRKYLHNELRNWTDEQMYRTLALKFNIPVANK